MPTATHLVLLTSTLVMACGAPAPAPAHATHPVEVSPPPMEVAIGPSDASGPPSVPAEGDGAEASIAVSALPQRLHRIEKVPVCSPADWSPQKLGPLLTRGRGATTQRVGQKGTRRPLLGSACSDSPGSVRSARGLAPTVDGVQIHVLRDTPAGKSGRGWQGHQCELEISFADRSGIPVVLGPDQVAPFNTVQALVRSGSAVWLSLGFNGYTREFPGGGNRVVAVDLCEGRVMWQSKDSVSNGGLLLVGNYLITAYGFTSERRYVFVLDPHSGSVVQKLPVIENVCPSKAWAPNWQPGQRCDAPGQAVGAATDPRLEDGLFMVDTNTGSSAFSFLP